MARRPACAATAPQLAEAGRDDPIAGARYVLARQFANPAGWELQNMLTVASLMVESALARTNLAASTSAAIIQSPMTPTGARHLSVVRSD